MNKRERAVNLKARSEDFPRMSEPVVGHCVGLTNHPKGLWLLFKGVRGVGGYYLSHILKESFRL